MLVIENHLQPASRQPNDFSVYNAAIKSGWRLPRIEAVEAGRWGLLAVSPTRVRIRCGTSSCTAVHSRTATQCAFRGLEWRRSCSSTRCQMRENGAVPQFVIAERIHRWYENRG